MNSSEASKVIKKELGTQVGVIVERAKTLSVKLS